MFCNYRLLQARKLPSRDRARFALKQEKNVRFAGRVLTDAESGTPVVYTENFFVKFREALNADECKAILQRYGLAIKEQLKYAKNAYFVAAPEGTGLKVFNIAERLLNEPDVELCHPELIRPVSRRALSPRQWHLALSEFGGAAIDAHINISDAWNLTKGENIVIAIIDDGVEIDHEEFNMPGKVVHGRDVTQEVDDPRPKAQDDNHGTACAGVACANGDFQATGVAPAAKLMPIRLRSNLASKPEADAFVWAADHGADVISCSWGPADGQWWNPHDSRHFEQVPISDMTRAAIDYALAHGRNGKGCVIIFAAGNGNESVDNDGYASYESVIAVAACNDNNRRSVYSDFGNAIWCCFPSSDIEWTQFNHPAPLTPGIWTTDRPGRNGYNPGLLNPTILPPGDDHGLYTEDFGGTSSSCPGVAGVVALILSVNSNLKPYEVKEILRRTSVKIDVTGGNYSSSGHSPYYGYGRVDALAAVQMAANLAERTVEAMAAALDDGPVFDSLVFEVVPIPNRLRRRLLVKSPTKYWPVPPGSWSLLSTIPTALTRSIAEKAESQLPKRGNSPMPYAPTVTWYTPIRASLSRFLAHLSPIQLTRGVTARRERLPSSRMYRTTRQPMTTMNGASNRFRGVRHGH